MSNIYLIRFVMVFIIFTGLGGCLPVIFTGAAGSALELAKDRPASDALADIRIASGIKAGFVKRDFRELYTKIKVEVVQGRVLYTGSIDKDEDAITAVEIAWNQKGVKEVINELIVDKKSSTFNLIQYTRDAMITSQIKSKTFMSRDIKFVNYTVITANDIVYLFGIARSEEELEKVAKIAANVNGVAKVVSHVKVSDSVNKSVSSDENSQNIIDTDMNQNSEADHNLNKDLNSDW